MVQIDRILFGDNQFFGVNHMSEEKARAQLDRFRDTAAILAVLEDAYDLGIRTFMCTTHDRIGEICDHVRAHPEAWAGFRFFPCMPYAHKYANSMGQVGLLRTIRRHSGRGLLGTAWVGARAVVARDAAALMRLLVDSEMRRFEGVPTPVVFLQNVVTDLLLGMGLHDLFAEFHAWVAERYGAEAGFITMNLPALLDALEGVGIRDPIVCANFNKIAFRTCGGLERYEAALRERRFRPIAMSVFASGAIPPEEALAYVCRQPNAPAILFGASSRAHIERTIRIVETLDAGRGGAERSAG